MPTARDVPEIRARLAAWASDTGTDNADHWFTFFLGEPDAARDHDLIRPGASMSQTLAATLRGHLATAELFYVSAEMTQLAQHAGRSLSDYRLHPEDLPAPVGFMLYENPPVDTAGELHNSITLVTWGPGRNGLWTNLWSPLTGSGMERAARLGRHLAAQPHDAVLDYARRAATPGFTVNDTEPAARDMAMLLARWLPNLERAPIPPSVTPPGYLWRGLHLLEFTDMNGWPETVDDGTQLTAAKQDLERTILATWLLMGQAITRSEPVTAPRSARRRITRIDPDLNTDVRYIQLRRARNPDATSDTGSSSRTYHHQWLVRGHWRNQWYPTRNDHRPIWIAPHIAGPEGNHSSAANASTSSAGDNLTASTVSRRTHPQIQRIPHDTGLFCIRSWSAIRVVLLADAPWGSVRLGMCGSRVVGGPGICARAPAHATGEDDQPQRESWRSQR